MRLTCRCGACSYWRRRLNALAQHVAILILGAIAWALVLYWAGLR